ncbi:DUF7544 domain-containing protein [Halobaculum roseum]|uniref:Membrane domain of glycerophosphoryl diester phosphodiesterase n=1 Tax=Halobaculum roseum TaxID=2175149 RepID=A0ABD5MQL0_9EURY|nr:hypothetical protein [Halobaculum roseum]QZY04472.1 hypothetical protein K6T36_17525 [Halobaculum roseum]
MSLHAVEDVDDAYRATKALLWPVDRSSWVKLAVIVLFAAGPGGGFGGIQTSAPFEGGGPGGGAGVELPGGVQLPATIGGAEWLVIATIVVLISVIVLGTLFIGSVMEFVLVESLRKETVSLREYWGRRWPQGVRLFGFRLLLGLVGLGSLAVAAALVVAPFVFDGGNGLAVPILTVLAVVPFIGALGLFTGLINGFTTVFVVPIMIREERTLLGAWGRLWSTITAEPWQYLAYAAVSVVLSVVGGVLASVAVGVGAVALLIPFGLLAAVGVLVATASELLGIVIVLFAALLFGLALIGVAALVQVPLVVYLRYYALLVLGDIEESLDLIADRRAAVRAADGGGGTAAEGGAGIASEGDDDAPDDTENGTADTDEN